MKKLFVFIGGWFLFTSCFAFNYFEPRNVENNQLSCAPLMVHLQQGSVRVRGKTREIFTDTHTLSCEDTLFKVTYRGPNKYVTEHFFMKLVRSEDGFAYLSSETGLMAKLPRLAHSACYRVEDERLNAVVCLLEGSNLR